jgi:hypothetical protein
MLKKLIILLLYLLPFLSVGQKAIVDENMEQNERNNSYDFYECKESEYLFEEGLAVIEFVDENTIYIKNETNTGYYGTHISFKIDKKMNVCDLKYYTWDDVEDGSITDFKTQDFDIRLNKNPFKTGIHDLQGIYHLKIISDFNPGEMLSKENIKPKTTHFTYRAVFECK